MTDFYLDFKQRREEHSITLEEISERTKINLRFLKAIEEGNFDILPETYMRLFLRAYAIEIGIDPDEAIEKLELYQGTITEPRPKPDKSVKPVEENSEPTPSYTAPKIDLKPKSKSTWKRSVIVLVIFGFVIWAVKSYVISTNTTKPDSTPTMGIVDSTVQKQQQAMQDTMSASISDEQFEKGRVVEQTQQSVKPVSNNKQIKLEFVAVGRTWVRVTRDTLPSEEYIFLPQDSKTWVANNRIELRIGNSAGAQLTLNGDRIEKLGAENTVTNLVINRNGILTKKTVVPQSVTTKPDSTD